MFADALIIKVNFLYLVPFRVRVFSRGKVGGAGHVVYFVARLAEEVCVRTGVTVVAGVPAVYGQGLDGGMFVQQLQRVVHRRFRQGGYPRSKCRIDLVYGRMRIVLHQVLHDGYPLYRRFDVVTL